MEHVQTRSNICGTFDVTKTDMEYSIAFLPSDLFKARNIPSKVINKPLSTDIDEYLNTLKLSLVSIFNEMSPVANYRIYGRFGNQRKFRAMNLRKGCQVGNLIYATLLTKQHADEALAEISKDNPEWQFEIRHV